MKPVLFMALLCTRMLASPLLVSGGGTQIADPSLGGSLVSPILFSGSDGMTNVGVYANGRATASVGTTLGTFLTGFANVGDLGSSWFTYSLGDTGHLTLFSDWTFQNQIASVPIRGYVDFSGFRSSPYDPRTLVSDFTITPTPELSTMWTAVSVLATGLGLIWLRRGSKEHGRPAGATDSNECDPEQLTLLREMSTRPARLS